MNVLRYLALIPLFFALRADANWQLVHRFSHPATCGYFFDRDNGFIGFGDAVSTRFTTAGIARTSDGGLTWTDCAVPSTTGRVTSIFMQSKLIGYASVMYSEDCLWKTTDGGVSWTGIVPRLAGYGTTCTYATPTALIRTMWFDVGGASTDDGKTFSQVFISNNGEERSNGIDFVDDLNGVVTMGPDAAAGWGAPASYTYYTSNGGRTWTRGGLMHESWGVYAKRDSRTYFSMAEDDANYPGNTLFWSRDGGKTWPARYGFGPLEFTGHIAGGGSEIYVQTSNESSSNIGLLRSDDDGQTWKKIGGPSNTRDTRFFVTGCRGEVVYAFDPSGGVWRTTDGGDGTLLPAPYIGAIESTTADKDVYIPIYYDTLPAPAPIHELSGTFSLNDDLLMPDSLELLNTQFDGAAIFDTLIQTSPGQWSYDIIFKPGTLLHGSQTLPLLSIHARTYVTDTTSTLVVLGNALTINGGIATPLMTCASSQNISGGLFELMMSCGDSALYQYMRGVQIMPSFTVRPNPARNELHLGGALPVTLDVRAVLYDAEGRIVTDEKLSGISGSFEHTILIGGLPSGLYLLRVTTSAGSSHTLKIVIDH